MPQPPDPSEALLAASHLAVPDDVPRLVHQSSQRMGARTATVYMVDLDQRWLVPLPVGGGPPPQRVTVDGTLAGRCYRSSEIVDTIDDSGDRYLWVPVIDGTERLGVIQFVVAADATPDRDRLRSFSGLVAELVVSKRAYGDFFEILRRSRPLTVAAELLWQLLPPLTFATENLVISGVFVPTHDLGGDAFDYGVDHRLAQVAIFDAMGHGLRAGLMATTAVAAYRNGRREQTDLINNARRIGEAIASHFGESSFVTGVLTSLELATGRLTWCGAGHPPPLVLRHGRVVKQLDARGGMPLGMGPPTDALVEQLEPGDQLLLYSDGVSEARDAAGRPFGVDQLCDLITRSAGDAPPPETLRRLMHSVEEHNEGPMRDDATVVMIEWKAAALGLSSRVQAKRREE